MARGATRRSGGAANGTIRINSQIDTRAIMQGIDAINSTLKQIETNTKKVGSSGQRSFNTLNESINKSSVTLWDLRRALYDLNLFFGIDIGVDSLTNLGKEAVTAASNLQEVQNVVDVTFGDAAEKINAFSKTALENYGLSELQAKSAASSFGAMALGIGKTTDEMAEMAITLTQLTGDFASFYNVSNERAQIALSGVFTGETETLKRYGIDITIATLQEYAHKKGIEEKVSAMTQSEKVMLRYNYVLERLAVAEGDYVRTQDNYANQLRTLQGSYEELLVTIGEKLIPIAEDGIGMLSGIVDSVKAFIAALEEGDPAAEQFFTRILGFIMAIVAYNAVNLIEKVGTGLINMFRGIAASSAQTMIGVVAVGTLLGLILQLSMHWDELTGMEKLVAIVLAVGSAFLAAALMVGAFQSALTMGIAIALISAGILGLMALLNNVESRANQISSGIGSNSAYGNAKSGVTPMLSSAAYKNVPKLATGAVIPANGEFLAVLGDQKHGRNLEAPESLIRQIVREESGSGGDVAVSINFEGSLSGLARYLAPRIEVAQRNRGKDLVKGGVEV